MDGKAIVVCSPQIMIGGDFYPLGVLLASRVEKNYKDSANFNYSNRAYP